MWQGFDVWILIYHSAFALTRAKKCSTHYISCVHIALPICLTSLISKVGSLNTDDSVFDEKGET